MMSEEVKNEEIPPKPKQYLVMVDEVSMAILGRLVPSMLFVQVEGMAMDGNANHMLLVNPIQKPQPIVAPLECSVTPDAANG